MLIETKGKILFSPPDVTKKHKIQTWKNVAMIITDCEIDKYYSWFLKKRFNVTLNQTLRGTHITFISDIIEDVNIFKEAAKIFNGKDITFSYDTNDIRSNGKYWWLKIQSPEADNIREAMGIGKPYFNYHLTLGYANEYNLEHSKYILDTIKKFNL